MNSRRSLHGHTAAAIANRAFSVIKKLVMLRVPIAIYALDCLRNIEAVELSTLDGFVQAAGPGRLMGALAKLGVLFPKHIVVVLLLFVEHAHL